MFFANVPNARCFRRIALAKVDSLLTSLGLDEDNEFESVTPEACASDEMREVATYLKLAARTAVENHAARFNNESTDPSSEPNENSCAS